MVIKSFQEEQIRQIVTSKFVDNTDSINTVAKCKLQHLTWSFNTHKWFICLQFIFKRGPKALPPSYFGLSSEAESPFVSTATAGVPSLSGEVSWDNPGGVGSTWAEPQSVSLLHYDLWQHGAVRVWGPRLRPRAMKVSITLSLTVFDKMGGVDHLLFLFLALAVCSYSLLKS